MKKINKHIAVVCAFFLVFIWLFTPQQEALDTLQRNVSATLIYENLSLTGKKLSKISFNELGVRTALNLIKNSIMVYAYSATATNVDTKTPLEHMDTKIKNKGGTTTDYMNDAPLVVIYHSHTTECYLSSPDQSSFRSKDLKLNMANYGDIVSQVLFYEYGIQTLHINEIFDVPYDSAYEKSQSALYKAKEKYPSIVYAIDIHRDGLSKKDSNFSVYQTQISGNKAAKIMLVLGTKSKSVKANTAFAQSIKQKAEMLYPGLYRKTLEKPYYYNQNIVEKSILCELGSNLSTNEEAYASAVYFGRVLGEVIGDELMEKNK